MELISFISESNNKTQQKESNNKTQQSGRTAHHLLLILMSQNSFIIHFYRHTIYFSQTSLLYIGSIIRLGIKKYIILYS